MRTIALLTDFGLKDHFVGVMKGVIAGIAPGARVIDISHEVEPYSVAQARFLLDQSWPWFPVGSIFVCVVDPGVGSARRPIAVKASRRVFVGPDNGLFSRILREPKSEARLIANRQLFSGPPSATFHGRDIFAPAAAHLARGVAFSRLGERIENALIETGGQFRRTGRRYWSGEIEYVDRYGNCVTNLPFTEFPDLEQRAFILRAGLRELDTVSQNYAAGAPGEPLLIRGSHGRLEIAVNQGSAAKALGIAAGSPVELEIP